MIQITLKVSFSQVVDALIVASKVEPNIFAEARREAMRALGW